MPEYFYHATLDEYLGNIADRGLMPPELRSAGTHWGGTFAQDADKVFFTDTAESALYYGEIIQKSVEYEDLMSIPDVIILRVAKKYLLDIKKGGFGSDEYYVMRSVPTEHIEFLMGEHGWKNLAENKDIAESISSFDWREEETIDEKKTFLRDVLRKANRCLLVKEIAKSSIEKECLTENERCGIAKEILSDLIKGEC